MDSVCSAPRPASVTRLVAPIGVLIAGRRSLATLLEHLLEEACDVAVVGCVEDGRLLTRCASELAPDVIVAHPRVLGEDAAARVAAARRSSPGSKLVLISSFAGLSPALRRCGADAFLMEDALVTRLLPTLKQLGRRERGRSST